MLCKCSAAIARWPHIYFGIRPYTSNVSTDINWRGDLLTAHQKGRPDEDGPLFRKEAQVGFDVCLEANVDLFVGQNCAVVGFQNRIDVVDQTARSDDSNVAVCAS